MLGENLIISLEKPSILVDAHVHIYDCYEIDTLFDAAICNFERVSRDGGLSESAVTAVLLLTETSRDNWFDQTKEKCARDQPQLSEGHSWHISTTLDEAVLKASKVIKDRGVKKEIYIIAGRQIVTEEGLELLALGTNSKFDDGLPVELTLTAIRRDNSIPVLPWAVGKWLGKRGTIVSRLIQDHSDTDLSLGDNSGRPVFWRNPAHFYQAKNSKLRLLPGSDPLPFPGEAKRVGSFGFMINGELSSENFSTDLKKLLRSDSTGIKTFGRLESCFRFFTNQLRLRLS